MSEFTSEDIKKAEPFARRYFKELGVKSPFFRAWFGDWREHDKVSPSNAVNIPQSRKYSEESRIVKNEDTQLYINIDSNVFEDNIHYAFKDKVYIERLLTKIDEIINKAILLDTRTSEKNNSNKKTPQNLCIIYIA